MALPEKICSGFALIFYLATIFFYLVKKQNEEHKSYNLLARWFFIFGIISHLFAIVFRIEFSSHFPLMGTYETTLSGTFVSVLIIYLFRKWLNIHPWFYAILLGFIVLMLIYGQFFPVHYIPTTISEQGLWVKMHVIFAWLALAFFLLSGTISLFVIFSSKDVQFYGELMFLFFVTGFLLLSIMMGTGIYYNFVLSGKWWTWDPIETSGLIVWLFASLIIHLHLFYRYNIKKLAKFIIISFVLVMLFYKGFPLIPKSSTFHNFDLLLGEDEHGNHNNVE